MAMSQLQVLELIVRPVLADFLAMTEKEERDLWLSCLLCEDLGITEEDLIELGWRLGRKLQEHNLNITVNAQELKGPRKTVSDMLTLICRKIDELEVPAVVVFSEAL